MNNPYIDKIVLCDSNTNLNPSLHRREPLTRFFLILGTCCTFFSRTIFPEVSFRSTVPTQEQKHVRRSPSVLSWFLWPGKKKTRSSQHTHEHLHPCQPTIRWINKLRKQ